VEREEGRYRGFAFSPIWPYRYAGELYRDIPKVLLMSATLTEKGLDLAGVPADNREFLSVPSHYPADLTPVSHVNTIRVNYRSTTEDLRQWVTRIDQIIDRRLDRKGIIFTVSYKRRDFLMTESRHGAIMVSHSTGDVIQAVDQFKRASAPRILVSPSVTSGYDFPGRQCDYIIIGKVPYPDTTPKSVRARQEEDPEWASYIAMQTIVQESGRGTRSPGDSCEVMVVDDNWRWFWPKNNQHAPQWFNARVRPQSTMVMNPPF
jgi:Rad3-related DNA helicase